jgi:hypothetical protein
MVGCLLLGAGCLLAQSQYGSAALLQVRAVLQVPPHTARHPPRLRHARCGVSLHVTVCVESPR